MAIIVEDGTGVPGANSYASVAQLRVYGATYGITLPVADADCEVLLLNAMRFIEAQTGRFMGMRFNDSQVLSWPRYHVWVDNRYILENEIPIDLVNAQLDIAARSQGIDLFPTRTSSQAAVLSKTVGPISVTYANASNNSSAPRFPFAEALLARLFNYRKLTAYKA